MVLGIWFWKQPPQDSKFTRFGKIFLVAHALLALGFYFQSGNSENDAFNDTLNEWEFFHYYLGSKYAPELGYYGLYEAALLADQETWQGYKSSFIRELKTGKIVPITPDILSRAQNYKSRFAPEQWDAFVSDVLYFKTSLFFSGKWDRILQDKGYNATPPWSLVVGLLSQQISISHLNSLQILASLDLILLTFAFLAIFRVFGRVPVCLLLIFLGTHPAMNHSHMKWAYLRMDWLVCLLFSVCALKKRYYGLAGFLTAYAAMTRIFPVVFSFGIAGLWLKYWVQQRKFHPEYSRYLLSFFLTLICLGSLTLFVLGADYCLEFLEKIQIHDQQLSLYRVGFKMVFLGTYQKVEQGNSNYIEKFERSQWLWWGLQIGILVSFFLAIKRFEPEAVQAMGFVPCYFLFAPTFYYAVVLLIPLLFFGIQSSTRSGLFGLILLFFSSLITFLMHDAWGFSCSAQTWYSLSLGSFFVAVWMLPIVWTLIYLIKRFT